MKRCLVVGKPNVGKTLFILNFAQYLHMKTINIKSVYPNGCIENKTYTIEEGRALLSSINPYKTLCLQILEMDIPVGKGRETFEIIDSSGLTDGIHKNLDIRRAMAQTLSVIQKSDIILHLFDISSLYYDDAHNAIGKVDYQLSEFGASREGYGILANKTDLIPNNATVVQLQKEFPQHHVIPISAMTKAGFSEVKTFVCRRL
ncbi:MAG: GTPase [Thermotaleaceae bacterium]